MQLYSHTTHVLKVLEIHFDIFYHFHILFSDHIVKFLCVAVIVMICVHSIVSVNVYLLQCQGMYTLCVLSHLDSKSCFDN